VQVRQRILKIFLNSKIKNLLCI